MSDLLVLCGKDSNVNNCKIRKLYKNPHQYILSLMYHSPIVREVNLTNFWEGQNEKFLLKLWMVLLPRKDYESDQINSQV